MSESNHPPFGRIGWIDITVPDAAALRDFYAAVVGWRSEGVDMGGYDDFAMVPEQGDGPAAGICYLRGVNDAIPPAVWLPYITVPDLQRCIDTCVALGGSVVVDRRDSGGFIVIRDPAGAVAALWQPD